MTIKALVTKIAKLEGKKSNVKIGDVREIIGHVSDIVFDEVCEKATSDTLMKLIENGERRARANARKHSKNKAT